MEKDAPRGLLKLSLDSLKESYANSYAVEQRLDFTEIRVNS